VITLAQEQLTLKAPGSEPYGVLGASLGGVIAMYAGMRLPQVFGKVISQSGAFDVSDFPGVIVDLVRYVPPAGIDIWMDVGRFEWTLEDNRKMFNLLQERKYRVKYHEFSGGHNFTSWRNDIWRGLEALFGKK
jgi:enterochelin esterase-like enzyme